MPSGEASYDASRGLAAQGGVSSCQYALATTLVAENGADDYTEHGGDDAPLSALPRRTAPRHAVASPKVVPAALFRRG